MFITRTNPAVPPTAERGSVLLEGLIAILIFSFGVLGLIGLQAASIKNTSQAKERIDASMMANARIASMWVDRAAWSSYTETNTDVSTVANGLPNGKRTTVVNGDTVTVTITWRMPGESSDNTFVTVAKINGNS